MILCGIPSGHHSISWRMFHDGGGASGRHIH
jgi:hypothetical protein